MKTFKINNGHGFHITFPNGVMLSTQFGWGNYCSNNYADPSIGLEESLSEKDWESDDAEIAIIGPSGWITREFKDAGDDVIGHVDIHEWLRAFDFCRNWKPVEDKEPGK